jgi:tRNA 2-thiouridine synthesizing protein A
VTPQSREPVVIDGGDRSCVRLLLELRARILGPPAGTVIHLIASDPAAPIDLPAWCHLTGHTYLGPIPAATRRPTHSAPLPPRPPPTPLPPGGTAPDQPAGAR